MPWFWFQKKLPSNLTLFWGNSLALLSEDSRSVCRLYNTTAGTQDIAHRSKSWKPTGRMGGKESWCLFLCHMTSPCHTFQWLPSFHGHTDLQALHIQRASVHLLPLLPLSFLFLEECTNKFIALTSASRPFCSGYFGDGVSRTICWGWPLTVILLISTSQVASITSMSHWHLAPNEFL
jgi:hypothetical protein